MVESCAVSPPWEFGFISISVAGICINLPIKPQRGRLSPTSPAEGPLSKLLPARVGRRAGLDCITTHALLNLSPMPCCLDASALVKHYVQETGSDALRVYLHGQPTWYTTPFCLYEALGVLKAKAKKKNRLDRITEDQYHNAGLSMQADFDFRSKHLRDVDFISPSIFSEVSSLCRKYPKLDFSDAFQIVSVKNGYYSSLSGDSQTVLVTADAGLAKAAHLEGLKVAQLKGKTQKVVLL